MAAAPAATFLSLKAPFNPEANDTAAEYVRRKIRAIVKDPETARKLSPYNHPIGTKRPPIDTDYFDAIV
jgi:cyclohexanone monooxygenase